MEFYYVFGIAVALAMDAFAVAVGVSLIPGGINIKQAVRLSLFFGLFQFIMPLFGWFVGNTFLDFIRAVDHWLAFFFLLVIGIKMIYESFRSQGKKIRRSDPTRGWPLLLLAIATSLDALAVGLSFAVLEAEIFYPAVVIGLVAFGLSLAGTRLGPLLGRVAGKWAEAAGGLILILIGVKILVEHL